MRAFVDRAFVGRVGVVAVWAALGLGGVVVALAGGWAGAWVGGWGVGVVASDAEGVREGLVGEVHGGMLASIGRGETEGGRVAARFAPGTSDDVIELFEAALARASAGRFQQDQRWSGGVAIGSVGGENEPLTLTYSFAPDGTFIGSGVGELAGNSDLFAYLDGIYGNTQTWQDLFHSVFARWGSLTGVTYVHEQNDDGQAFFGNAGQLGLRGDVRIGGKFIDGVSNPNILGYNMFPGGGGDMVLDTSDTYFLDISSSSRRLRNVVSHEHGHGLGLRHVCPILSQKLMEPFATTAFDGPQHDDIRGAQDFYGDVFEPNENAIGAEDVGLVAAGTTLEPGLVTSPVVTNGSRLSLNEKDTSPFTNDEDWYRFSTDGASFVTVSVSPLGSTYQDNPQLCAGQTASCCSGTMTNSLWMADLALELRRVNGSQVVGSSDSNGLGGGEVVADYESLGADTFHVRVYTTTNGFMQPQSYSLSITSAPPSAPGAFVLVSPLNAAMDVETGPILDWTGSVGADDYLVEVDTSIVFGSPDVSQLVDAGFTGVDLADGTLAHDTQYFWRVTANNGLGNTVSTPSVSGFRTAEAVVCGCAGDVDGDCDTDVYDFGVFSVNFGQSVAPGTGGDFDGDGDVDVVDFAVLSADFGCVDP